MNFFNIIRKVLSLLESSCTLPSGTAALEAKSSPGVGVVDRVLVLEAGVSGSEASVGGGVVSLLDGIVRD